MSLEEIKNLIKIHHNPKLVDVNKAPNANIQTLLFNDGEIMSTKGGDAFLKRSFFSVKPPLNFSIEMPTKYGNYTYSIIKNEEIAIKIRNMMIIHSQNN